MKYTLLDIVQTCLDSMDSDEVNTIFETPESSQVVTIVKTVFLDLCNRVNLPEQFTLVQLDPSGDDTKPCLMYLPEGVKELLWLKYDVQTYDDPVVNYQPLKQMELTEFLTYSAGLREVPNTASMLVEIDDTAFTFFYQTDRAPQYYCTIDERLIVFDAYDPTVDTTLQRSKTQGYGQKTVYWSPKDDFIPPLDDKQFSVLVNEAKALCWAELKQTQHASAERSARRAMINTQRTKDKVSHTMGYHGAPRYGRRR